MLLSIWTRHVSMAAITEDVCRLLRGITQFFPVLESQKPMRHVTPERDS